MAEGEEMTDQKLGDVFEKGFDIFTKIEAGNVPFNSDEFQDDVKKAIRLFEDSTRLVSSIGMFSTNEIVDEIPSEHLKYLLLPFFLGQLSTKCITYDREEAVKISEIYHKDFLKRCEDYGICNSSNTNNTLSNTNPSDLIVMAKQRNAKIESYRRKKELEEQVNEMRVAVEKDHVDDEVKRKFYLQLINLNVMTSKEELESIAQEKEILEFKKASISESQGAIKKKPTKPPHQPLKPIIITKDSVQKAVFGLGYPSLPEMTVDEFYEQRVQEGIFPNAQQVVEMNKKMLNPEDPELKEEREKAENEVLEEADDTQHLERQRALDDYKDVVRRGDGNRYNRS